MRKPSASDDELAEIPTRHRQGRRRKKKRSKKLKNIITVVVLAIMVLVILWFAVRFVMDLGGAGHAE